MPRHYIKKKPPPSYTEVDVQRAVLDVQNKTTTFQQAQEKYGVPKSVIFHRIKGRKVPLDRIGAGRPTVLSKSVEDDLENCIKARARMGYPCSKDDIINIVAEYVKVNNLHTPFHNGIPGNDWYYSFMQRHKSLVLKKPEHLQKLRKEARKPEIVYDFYDELRKLVEKCNLTLEKSCFVFNCDESGFCSDPKRLRAIGERGKNLVRVSGGSGRESTTVLAAVSADGYCLPPLIVHKGVAVQPRWISREAYPGTIYTTSKNGWMEEPQFFEWFNVQFIPHIQKLRQSKQMPNQTALLIFDGHSSHISCRIVKAALENNIELFKLPSHLTDKLQPLDKCVFGPVKTYWEKQLVNFGKRQLDRPNHDTGRLSKCKFAELLGETWRNSMKKENIVKGFFSTGIFPVDSTKFPESEFHPLDLQTFKKKQIDRPNSSQSSMENQTVNYLPTVSTNNSAILSSPARVSQPQLNELHVTPKKNIDTPKFPTTPTSLISIFSQSISPTTDTKSKENINSKKTVPRLKPLKYGEILTTEEVLEKLSQAEAAKINKTSTRKKNSGPKRKRKTENDDNDEEMRRIDESDKSDEGGIDNLQLEMEMELTPEVEYEKADWNNVSPGKFVLVDFVGGNRQKTHYKYVCCVQHVDEDEDEISVTGYKCNDELATVFILKENDECTVALKQILAVLPDPAIKERDRKILYAFPGSVSVFEK